MDAIELHGVTKRFRGQAVLNGIDLRVPRGSMFGLIGLNGAGKTTTLRVALGMLRPDGGRARLLGVDAVRVSSLSGRVGATLHGVGLDPALTVRDNLRRFAYAARRGAVRVETVLERLALGRLVDRRVAKLSQGERQRAAIARALLLDPELLVLDEPLTHLDPGAVSGVLEALREAVRSRGATVLLSSHQLEHVERSTDRFALIHDGVVRVEGRTGELIAGVGTVVIRADPRDLAERTLRAIPAVTDVRPPADDGPDTFFRVRTSASPGELNARLHAAGCRVDHLAPARRTLDDLFHEAIGTPAEDAA